MDLKAVGTGRLIAAGVIIVVIILAVLGRLDPLTAGIYCALAAAVILR